MNKSWNALTQDQYLSLIKNKHKNKKNLCFDDVIYTGMNNYVDVICKIHGMYKYKASSVSNENFQCKFCKRELRHYNIAKKHCDNFIKLAKEKFKNIDYSSVVPDENSYKNIFYIICPIHGKQKVYINTFLKNGCPKCDMGINAGKAVNRKYTNDEFINELKNIYGDKYDYSEVNYINWLTKVKLKCQKHGIFFREPSRLIHDVRGCPYCNKSLLEDKIQKFLDEKNIKYIREFTHKCLGLKRLDFYLPEYNAAIECQGRQHFFQNSIYNKNISIDDVINNDKIKYELCIENGINVYYFTNINYKGNYFVKLYKDKDELLNHIISDNEKLL